MKKFRFTLDMVLSYKQQVLDALMAEHAVILQRLRQQEERIESLWQHYRDYNAEYRARSSQGLSITDAMICEANLRAIEREIEQQTEVLRQIQDEEEKKREEVIEGRKDTSSLEKLKDKKYKEYQKAEQKSEENFIEEFVSTVRATASH